MQQEQAGRASLSAERLAPQTQLHTCVEDGPNCACPHVVLAAARLLPPVLGLPLQQRPRCHHSLAAFQAARHFLPSHPPLHVLLGGPMPLLALRCSLGCWPWQLRPWQPSTTSFGCWRLGSSGLGSLGSLLGCPPLLGLGRVVLIHLHSRVGGMHGGGWGPRSGLLGPLGAAPSTEQGHLHGRGAGGVGNGRAGLGGSGKAEQPPPPPPPSPPWNLWAAASCGPACTNHLC